jgi:hypothetical protein
MADKCWKGNKHDYETVNKTGTHIIQVCTVCKGRKWKHRNTGIKPLKFAPNRV